MTYCIKPRTSPQKTPHRIYSHKAEPLEYTYIYTKNLASTCERFCGEHKSDAITYSAHIYIIYKSGAKSRASQWSGLCATTTAASFLRCSTPPVVVVALLMRDRRSFAVRIIVVAAGFGNSRGREAEKYCASMCSLECCAVLTVLLV